MRLVLSLVRLVVGLVLRLLRLVLETSRLWYFAIQFMITSLLRHTWVGAFATQPLDPLENRSSNVIARNAIWTSSL